jgi:hypothetical protein
VVLFYQYPASSFSIIIVEMFSSNRKISTSKEMVRLALAAATNGSVVYIYCTNHRNMYITLFNELFSSIQRKIPKSKKLQAQPAQAPNETDSSDFNTCPRSHHLLAVIRSIPYFPLLGPLKTKTMKTAYIQMHLFHLSTLGWHQFLCGKGESDCYRPKHRQPTSVARIQEREQS